jgi:hypothetical protein
MFPLPLGVTVKPSRRLRLGIAAFHLLAAAALWLAALPVTAQLAGSALLVLGLILGTRPTPETTLRGKADGTLEIRQNDTWQEITRFPPALSCPSSRSCRCDARTDPATSSSWGTACRRKTSGDCGCGSYGWGSDRRRPGHPRLSNRNQRTLV